MNDQETILALTLENQSMRHLLARCEFRARIEDEHACPICGGVQPNTGADPSRFDIGHRSNCALVSAIAGKGAA